MKGKITKKAIDALIAEAKAAGGAVFLWDNELAGFGAAEQSWHGARM